MEHDYMKTVFLDILESGLMLFVNNDSNFKYNQYDTPNERGTYTVETMRGTTVLSISNKGVIDITVGGGSVLPSKVHITETSRNKLKQVFFDVIYKVGAEQSAKVMSKGIYNLIVGLLNLSSTASAVCYTMYDGFRIELDTGKDKYVFEYHESGRFTADGVVYEVKQFNSLEQMLKVINNDKIKQGQRGYRF